MTRSAEMLIGIDAGDLTIFVWFNMTIDTGG
jgi:hypothetical protein